MHCGGHHARFCRSFPPISPYSFFFIPNSCDLHGCLAFFLQDRREDLGVLERDVSEVGEGGDARRDELLVDVIVLVDGEDLGMKEGVGGEGIERGSGDDFREVFETACAY